jgi:hypothetical protein
VLRSAAKGQSYVYGCSISLHPGLNLIEVKGIIGGQLFAKKILIFVRFTPKKHEAPLMFTEQQLRNAKTAFFS